MLLHITSLLPGKIKLKEGHRKDTIPDVLSILETLEEFDSLHQTTQESRKPRHERNSKPKKEYNSKREKPCKLPNHQGHEYSDRFNTPHSNKFKGTSKTLKDSASMSESNTDESKEEHNNIESDKEYKLFN